MNDVSIMHIGPVPDPTGICLLVVETDNWASCEVVGNDTDYEVMTKTTYAWSESVNGERHKVFAFETEQVNGVPLKNLWFRF